MTRKWNSKLVRTRLSQTKEFCCCSITKWCLSLYNPRNARLPCPSLSRRVCLNSCPLSQWCHPTISRPLLLLPSSFLSIRVFSNELTFHTRWPKDWNFTFSTSLSSEYSELISFRMNWLYLPALQGTLKSLLQHHSSKASVLQSSAFFMVQFPHPYMTTEKAISLTVWIFVGKVMSLLFNMLSRLVIAFLPRSKCLLISWLWSPSAVILEPKKIKSLTVSIVSLSIFHELIGPDAIS